jgi:hypothetical protein
VSSDDVPTNALGAARDVRSPSMPDWPMILVIAVVVALVALVFRALLRR